jgi:hypothetical protein
MKEFFTHVTILMLHFFCSVFSRFLPGGRFMARETTKLFLAMVMFLSATPVAADTKDNEARALFAEGRELFEAEKFHDASLKFRAAYSVSPNFRLLYNIAQSEAAARRYGQALEAFEQYLADAGDDITTERIDEVRQEIERLKSMVGFIEVETIRGAQIRIDGEPRGIAPVFGGVPVVAGKIHTVDVVVNGQALPAEGVKVTSGKTVTVTMLPDKTASGEPAPVVVAPHAPLEAEAVSSEESKADGGARRWMAAGWSVLGAGAVCLGVGAVTGGLVLQIENDLNEKCPDGDCSSAQKGDMDRQHSLAVTSTVMFSVGAAAAVTGLVLLIVGKRASERIAVTPVVRPDAAGAVATVNF